MAKSATPKNGPSRIRFVMLEADVQDGDLSQITQAIQNAFRSPSVVAKAPPAPTRMITAPPLADIDAEYDEVIDPQSEQVASNPAPASARPPRKLSVAKTPDVLSDIDVDSEPSLKDFVSKFEIKTGFEKYLVIGLWFREARSTNSFTVDHIYTCFRVLGWSTTSTNFSKPLWNLRDDQSIVGDGKGYSLTLVGAGKIESKRRSAA